MIASPALAGTTGNLNGTVKDNGGAPIAGVSVSLRSPSGTYQATTDSKGFYAIAGIYADTYSASFQKSGYNGQVVTGISIFADQTLTVNATFTKELRTITTVTARSSASAFQPQLTTDTYTVNAQQIQNLQGSDLNISESNLITSLPGATYDSSGYPVIHGGRENEEGFEFEGIPYTDAFTNQFVNTLALPGSGIASAQLTPGAGDASVQSNGTGVINLVAQRGTYPGFSQIEAGVGGGQFQHILNASMSYAGANGHISNYAAFSGTNTGYVFGNNAYTAQQLGDIGGESVESDREFLDNLVFRFGKNNNQQLQLFADVAEHNFYLGNGGPLGQCLESCNPFFAGFNAYAYGLTPAQTAELAGVYPYQTSIDETVAQANRPNTIYQPNETYKIQYTVNFNSSSFLQAMLYSVNSVSLFDEPVGGANFYGDGDVYLYQGGHSLGGTLKFDKQFGESNDFEAGLEYAWRHPEDSYISKSFGSIAYAFYSTGTEPYDFVNPSDPTCPIIPYGGTCGYAYTAFGANAPSQLTLPPFDQVASVQRADQSIYAQDKVSFGDHVHADFGLRLETSNYQGFPTPQLLSNCTFLYNPSSYTINPLYNPANPETDTGGTNNCEYLPQFDVTRQETNPSILEPRLGLSWQVLRNTALRFTYSRAATFPFLSFVSDTADPAGYSAYNVLPAYNQFSATPNIVPTCGFAPYFVNCSSYGQQLYWANQNFDGVPYQPLLPMISNNYQVTLSQQFTKGFLNGVALSIGPWTRHQYDTEASLAQPLLVNGQPKIVNGNVVLGPSTATNLGKEYASGVDFNLTKTNELGLSGQLTASYVNEFSSVLPTSGGEDFFPSIPYASGLLGGVYRVGFLSPFQTTLALSYKTRSGWRFNPRFSYNIGYPTGVGTLTQTLVNGTPYTVPNTNENPGGSASSEGIGPYYYVDPENPGSLFNPNVTATRGTSETTSPGGKLTPPNLFANITIEYAPPTSRYKIGFDVENIFDRLYSGPGLNGSCQIVATGLCGPLSGYSTLASQYSVPYATPIALSQFGGQSIYTNFPSAIGRTYYVYLSAKI